jgi:ribonuclease HI
MEIFCDAGYDEVKKLAGCAVYIPSKGITYGASYRNITNSLHAEAISLFLASQLINEKSTIYSDCKILIDKIKGSKKSIRHDKFLLEVFRNSQHDFKWRDRLGNGYANAVATQQLKIARKDISKTLEFM